MTEMTSALPPIQYTKSGEVNIAYEVRGAGPIDLVFVSGWAGHLEMDRERPLPLVERLASFSRLIRFDKRGTGMSDSLGESTLEKRMDDVRAVMDAAGSQRAAVLGISEGGPIAILFAATYPERTKSLILYGTYPRRVSAPDYPWAPSPEWWVEYARKLEEHWGVDAFDIELRKPSVAGDPAARAAWVEGRRRTMSPGAARALAEVNSRLDVRHVLPSVRVPTLILHVTGDRVASVEGARYMAERIAHAKLVEYEGTDHNAPRETWLQIGSEIQLFLTGARPNPDPERVLATVLFTDIVGSTKRAHALGDLGWRDLLASHHATVRRLLELYRGREIDTAGDGFLAAFDGPARAIRCAAALRDALRAEGIDIRAGLHTGECNTFDGKLSGIAVHIGNRVAALAGAGDVLASSTVHDLVAGSGIVFDEGRVSQLRDVPGEYRIYRVVSV
jgi:pimeloyl-ACP methyl ester carboxylesterase